MNKQMGSYLLDCCQAPHMKEQNLNCIIQLHSMFTWLSVPCLLEKIKTKNSQNWSSEKHVLQYTYLQLSLLYSQPHKIRGRQKKFL